MYTRQMRSIKHYRDSLTVVVDISLQGTRCSSVLNSSISFPIDLAKINSVYSGFK